MSFNKETFCTMPWSSIMILPSGDFKICCFTGHDTERGDSHGVAVDDDYNIMNVLTHNIMDAMNSKWHKELRLAQSRGERHEICKVCWDRDDAAKVQGEVPTSLRVVRSYYQNNGNRERIGGYPMKGAALPETADSLMAADGTITKMPLSLDIRFSNLCNAKCVMCEPLYSTLWYGDWMDMTGRDEFFAGTKQYKIIKKPTASGGATYSSDIDVWNDDPRWWAQFDQIAPHLRHVYITGGEPFVQPTHDTFIQKLVEGGYAKNIVIEYDTNLSVLNTKILDMLKEFKDLIFRISVDDVEERYDLIRHPLKFNKLLANLELMKEYGFHEKIVNLSTCVGIYSIYSPIRIYEYFKAAGYDRHFPFVRILRSPAAVDMANLPRRLKEKVIKDYEESDLPHFHQTHVVGYLKNTLDKFTDKECEAKMNSYMKYMDTLDKLRKTDWKATFPEVAELVKDYIPK